MKNPYFIDTEGTLLIEAGPTGKTEFTLKRNIAAFFKTNYVSNSLDIIQDSVWRPVCAGEAYSLFLCPGKYRLHVYRGSAGLYITGIDGLNGIGQNRADVME